MLVEDSEYEESILFGRHLDYFITNYGFAPRKLANDIDTGFAEGTYLLSGWKFAGEKQVA